MADIILKKITEAFYQVQTESGIAFELSDYFSFRPKGYEFMPAFKAKAWDGYVRLFQPLRPKLLRGHKNLVKEFAEDRGYSLAFEGEDEIVPVTRDEVEAFCESLNLSNGKGSQIKAHAHQVDAVTVALNQERCLLLSPTASGKSLIIYILLRYLQENALAKTMVLTVPTASLVDQMYTDFMDYSEFNGWSVEANARKVRAGLEKKLDKYVTITTWQSIQKMPAVWFHQVDGVLVDEAHSAAAKSLTYILESMQNAWFRVGLTGTIDDTEAHKLVLTGLMGTPYRVTTTKELIDNGTLAQFEVKGVRLVYDDQDKKIISKLGYQEELDFVLGNAQRCDVIKNIIAHAPGNSLVLFDRLEHGKLITETLKKAFPNRKIYYVAGEISIEKREDIRAKVDADKDAVIVASFGTYRMGINIKNLNNLIFAHPGKAKIRTLQSIGRGLRKATNGLDTTLYDLVDDLSWKSKICYAIQHAAERFRFYSDEKFKVSTVSFKMKKVL